jgi:hypothetical protein
MKVEALRKAEVPSGAPEEICVELVGEDDEYRVHWECRRKPLRSEGIAMIRQAISCDICAAEKRQTNHWFVAYEQGGELRVSGWTSRHRLRPDSKHLCGQTCLHKLVDEFMAKCIARRAQRNDEAAEAEAEPTTLADTSLTSAAAQVVAATRIAAAAEAAAAPAEVESSARLITPPAPALSAPPLPKPAYRPQSEVVTMPSRQLPHEFPQLPADTLRYASRRWHAEAWERERERELRAVENHPDIAARRRTSA